MEFRHLIRTRVFLLSLVLVPAFSLGLTYLQSQWGFSPDLATRHFAVVDGTGQLFGAIEAAAQREGGHLRPVLLLPDGQTPGQAKRQAIQRVRSGELFAYVEIAPGTLQPRKGVGPALFYFSNTPTNGELAVWLDAVLNAEIRRLRLRALGFNAKVLDAAEAKVPIQSFSIAPGPEGQSSPVGPAQSLVPAGSMLLLFLMVMLTAPQMMSSVIEEKMSRISEVLLASVSPFDLMLGKLLACCGASVLVGTVYAAGGLALARHFGVLGTLSVQGIAAFGLCLVLAVFLHGSLYMAVGAACSQPKDAQGLLGPLVLLTSFPLFALGPLLQDPSCRLAKVLSLFPLSAPFVLCFRLNSRPAPALADVALSILLTVGATLFCVWAASRVLRVGLLSQGKAPGPTQLLRWVFMK